MKPPENIDDIREDCKLYFKPPHKKDLSEFDLAVTIPVKRQHFEAFAPEYVKVLLNYIDKLEKRHARSQ